MARVQELKFESHGDDRGKLIALEALSEQVPFEVKRVYYIFDTTPGTVRGKHAHRQLKQVLVCLAGACTIDCELPRWHQDIPLSWLARPRTPDRRTCLARNA